MSKISLINRLKLIKRSLKHLFYSRKILIKLLKKILFFSDFKKFNYILQKLSKKSNKQKLRVFCWHTGRVSGLINMFGISRLSLRLLGQNCIIPGLKKSSW